MAVPGPFLTFGASGLGQFILAIGSEPELALAAVADVDFREFSVKHRSTGNTGSLRLMEVPRSQAGKRPIQGAFQCSCYIFSFGFD